jgi:hypothetical protein
MSRVVVVLWCDAATPHADGFVNRNQLVVESLRRHHDVTVLGIAPDEAALVEVVDDPFIEPDAFAPLTSKASRVRRLVELRAGRAGFARYERRLTQRLRDLRPEAIVAMTYRQCDLVRSMRGVAPTVLFAEERFGRVGGMRRSKIPPLLSNALGRAQRDVARGLPVVAVLSEEEVAWASRRYESPVVVVPHGFDHRFWEADVAPNADAGPLDILVIGNLQLDRTVGPLVSILDELDGGGWPEGLRIVAISATGYAPALATRVGKNLVLPGAVDDPRPFYRGAAATLVPAFRAFGTKNGIIQGWGARCPVVTTPASAATVGATNGIDVLVGEDPRALAELLRSIPTRGLQPVVDGGTTTLWRNFSARVHDDSLDVLVAELVAPAEVQ